MFLFPSFLLAILRTVITPVAVQQHAHGSSRAQVSLPNTRDTRKKHPIRQYKADKKSHYNTWRSGCRRRVDGQLLTVGGPGELGIGDVFRWAVPFRKINNNYLMFPCAMCPLLGAWRYSILGARETAIATQYSVHGCFGSSAGTQEATFNCGGFFLVHQRIPPLRR